MAAQTSDLDIPTELRQISSLAEVGKDALTELAAASSQRRVHAGLSLVDQGVPSQSLNILVRGAAKLVRTLGDGGDESVVVLDVMRAPCIVADSSVIDGGPAFATVTTLRSSHVLTVDRRSVLRLLSVHPSIARALLARFALEVRSGVRRIDEIVAGPVDERVTNLLDSLALAHGTPLGQGRFIAIPLRRRDLANMVNATTETVSRLLAKFEREGQARSTRDGIWWRSAPAKRTASPSQSGIHASIPPVSATLPIGAPVRQGVSTG
jgi:CRP/FNR family cyclic AMP-dependent transcriptional regulator